MVDLHGLAQKIDIHDIAVCHADPFYDVEQILLRDRELGILPPFAEKDISKRVNPKATLDDASGFIVILEAYKPTIYKKREGRYGNISPAATGEDYHQIVQAKLNALVDALKVEDPEGKYIAFVDNSPFSEKHVAYRAGLGRTLKNGLFYSKKYGSRCYIGIILTNRAPEYYNLSKRKDQDDPVFERCKTCGACLRLCPGKALTEDGMNSYRCVAYLTQKKEALTREEEEAMADHVYGCDICQKICPLNEHIPVGYETGMEVSLDQLLSMSNKEFKLKYQKTAAGWRGKKQLQKNAAVVLRNLMER